MHVFVDTNILLNFFHYSKDELDALANVFASHEHGSATVHLTEQVQNEFRRNREAKIKDALKKFKDSRYAPQFPSFMKGYAEYKSIRSLDSEISKLNKAILEKVESDISARKLIADLLIDEIFAKQKVVPVSKDTYERAIMRTALGNPPGKSGSLGDAVNWEILLASVPNAEDLHIISEDGDFYSSLSEDKVHPFLADEWKRQKEGKLFAYRTLSAFMVEHFDGVAFAFDKGKEALIDALFSAGSFASSHSIIAKLENYKYFSAKELQRILDAAEENNQFGWILSDDDVTEFLRRVGPPHIAALTPSQKETLEKILPDADGNTDA